MKRSTRMELARQTVEIVERGSYQSPAGRVIDIAEAVRAYLAATRPTVYANFADDALLDVVRQTWVTVVAAHPTQPIIGLVAYEVGAGLMVLLGDRRYALVGAVLMMVFHVALMAFGWGFWLWSAPMLALLVVLLDGLRVTGGSYR